jgi:hypothetical protein
MFREVSEYERRLDENWESFISQTRQQKPIPIIVNQRRSRHISAALSRIASLLQHELEEMMPRGCWIDDNARFTGYE